MNRDEDIQRYPKQRRVEMGRSYEEKYQAWVQKVLNLVGFDENADYEDLQSKSEQFEALRKLWVAGEPLEGNAELQKNVNTFYKEQAKVHSSDTCLEIERAFSLLSIFCLEKSRAAHKRLLGLIAIALQHESSANRYYQQLPTVWKW